MKSGRESSPACISVCSRRSTQCFWTVIRCRVWCCCKKALLDKMDKASLIPAISASSLCAFSPLRHDLGNAQIVQFGEVLHHSRRLDVRGISVTSQLPVKFLHTGGLLFLDLVRLRNSRVTSQSMFRQILGEIITQSMMTPL